jgi:signal transduction histidine kinase
MRRSAGADEREYLALLAIRDGVARALRLLDGHTASRPATPHQLQDLVELAVRQMPSARIQDIRVRRLTQDAPVVSADPDAVVQIVTNLLNNAAKYSTPNTPIEVEIGEGDEKGFVTVRDWGIGVEPESMGAIFNGYRTTRARQMAGGQGIGLRLSRRLAQEADGRLWAAHAPGHGTILHLELPLSVAAPRETVPRPLRSPDTTVTRRGARSASPRPAASVESAASR